MLLTNELTKPEELPQELVSNWASAGDFDGDKKSKAGPALAGETELTYKHS